MCIVQSAGHGRGEPVEVAFLMLSFGGYGRATVIGVTDGPLQEALESHGRLS